MKFATEYVYENDTCTTHEPGSISFDDAVNAVQQALDDAEHYKSLLLRAIRNSPSTSIPTTHATPE